MIKLTDIISKPVVSIFDCKQIGIIENVLFNKLKKTIEYFIIYDEKNDALYSISIKSIVGLNNFVLVKNISELCLKSDLDLEITPYENLMNKNIIDINGENLGKINEIILDEKFKIISFGTTKNEILNIDNIIKIEDIILYSKSKINMSKYKKKIQFKKPQFESQVSVQNFVPKLPNKAAINEKLLLNRVVYSNIYSGNETIIKSNTVITNSIIETAKKYGKLKELVKYSF